MTSSGIQLITSVGESQCAFCSVDISEGQGIVLNKCLHTFCRECLKAAIEQSNDPQIKCPVSDQFFCDGCLLDPEIKALVSPQAYEKYLARSLTQAAKEDDMSYSCKMENCPGLYYLEKDVTNFKCTLCQMRNCVKCKGLHDVDITCPQRDKRKGEEVTDAGTVKQQHLEESEVNANKELKTDWDNRWEQMQKLVQANTNQNGENGDGVAETLLLDLLETSDTLISTEPFECPICMMDIPANTGIILQECFHTFCPDCLKSTIEHCEEPVVKCPFKGTHTSCDAEINEREVKSLVSQEIYDRYLARSISTAEMSTGNSFHCKTLNCKGWCECDGVSEFKCPICKKTNCTKCKAIHEGISCEKYRMREIASAHKDEEIASAKKQEELIKSGKAMRCPKCKILIIKNRGCEHMVCSACHHEFNWDVRRTPINWKLLYGNGID